MPILFPIALLSMIVLYVTERFCLAYYYKEPPMFDPSLNRLAINIIILAPLLYCIFGFWMFGNIQIFRNQIEYYFTFSEHILTGHNWMTAFVHDSLYSIPLFITFGLQIIVIILRKYFARLTLKYFIDIEKLDEHNQEHTNFYECLTLRQRKWLIKDELATRTKFGFKKLDDSTLMKLKDV